MQMLLYKQVNLPSRSVFTCIKTTKLNLIQITEYLLYCDPLIIYPVLHKRLSHLRTNLSISSYRVTEASHKKINCPS